MWGIFCHFICFDKYSCKKNNNKTKKNQTKTNLLDEIRDSLAFSFNKPFKPDRLRDFYFHIYIFLLLFMFFYYVSLCLRFWRIRRTAAGLHKYSANVKRTKWVRDME